MLCDVLDEFTMKIHTRGCHVMSCYVSDEFTMKIHTPGCHVMLCDVLDEFTMKIHTRGCHVMSCHVSDEFTMKIHTRGCHVMSCHVSDEFTMKIHTRGCGDRNLGSDDACTHEGNSEAVELLEGELQQLTQLDLEIEDLALCGCGFDQCNTADPEEIAEKAGGGKRLVCGVTLWR